MVRKLSYAFDLGNGQFDGEVPVWSSHSIKRLESRKETETLLGAYGTQYPKSGVSGGHGCRGATLEGMCVNFVPKPSGGNVFNAAKSR